MRSVFFYILIIALTASCASKVESQLMKALKGAVKEKKVTEKKMQSILTEYDRLREEDKPMAREYVDQVLSAIKMGGDPATSTQREGR